MHVLVIAQRPPYPPNKGEKIRTFHQIRYLVEQGHSVTVCSPICSDRDRNDLLDFKHHLGVNVLSARKPGKLALIQGLFSGKPLSVSNFYSKILQKRIDQALIENNFDSILCTSSSLAEYVFRSPILKSANRPRLIMDFMDLDSNKWLQYQQAKPFPMSWIYGREHRLLKQYERKIHRYFDASLFVAHEEVDLFLTTEKDLGRLFVVSNGLDLKAFPITTAKKEIDHPTLLFTGVMDYFPNSDAVIAFVTEAWPHILKRWSNAKFFIAGMNPTPQVKALERYQGVTVTGYVDDILPYYESADFFVAPFRIARGLQNKVLQAFSCALPVIASPIANEGINAKDGEELLVAHNPEEYVNCLERLIQTPDLRRRLAKNARSLVEEQYSWAGQLAPFEHILERHQCSSGAVE